jgi:hypothetical protein
MGLTRESPLVAMGSAPVHDDVPSAVELPGSFLAAQARPFVQKVFSQTTQDILYAGVGPACLRLVDDEATQTRAFLNANTSCRLWQLREAKKNVLMLGEFLYPSKMDTGVNAVELDPPLAAKICIWNAIYRVCCAWRKVENENARLLAAHAFVYETLCADARKLKRRRVAFG